MRAIRMLLESSIDYAGLFPPAGLDMPPAVQNYAGYRTGSMNAVLKQESAGAKEKEAAL